MKSAFLSCTDFRKCLCRLQRRPPPRCVRAVLPQVGEGVSRTAPLQPDCGSSLRRVDASPVPLQIEASALRSRPAHHPSVPPARPPSGRGDQCVHGQIRTVAIYKSRLTDRPTAATVWSCGAPGLTHSDDPRDCLDLCVFWNGLIRDFQCFYGA